MGDGQLDEGKGQGTRAVGRGGRGGNEGVGGGLKWRGREGLMRGGGSEGVALAMCLAGLLCVLWLCHRPDGGGEGRGGGIGGSRVNCPHFLILLSCGGRLSQLYFKEGTVFAFFLAENHSNQIQSHRNRFFFSNAPQPKRRVC